MTIYPPRQNPSTSIRYSAVFRGRYIWDIGIWSRLKSRSVLGEAQRPNPILILIWVKTKSQYPRYTYREKLAEYRILVLGFWRGGFVVLSVLGILFGFCIYAASQIHDSNHWVQLLIHYPPYWSLWWQKEPVHQSEESSRRSLEKYMSKMTIFTREWRWLRVLRHHARNAMVRGSILALGIL